MRRGEVGTALLVKPQDGIRSLDVLFAVVAREAAGRDVCYAARGAAIAFTLRKVASAAADIRVPGHRSYHFVLLSPKCVVRKLLKIDHTIWLR